MDTTDSEYDILDEYVDVTNKIKEIRTILNRYREDMKRRLEKAATEDKRSDILKRFQEKMYQIQKSDLITKQYQKLKKRQDEIREILLPSDNSSDSNINSSTESDTLSDIESNTESSAKSIIDSKFDKKNIAKNGEDVLSFLEKIKIRIS